MSAYSLSLVTPPATLPLDVPEVRAWLRVTSAADDTMIERLIRAATEAVEKLLNRQLVTATWQLGLPAFPRGYLRLPRSPLRSVTSITYYDVANQLQTLAASYYDVDALSDPGTVSLAQGYPWPATYTRPNAVLVTYSAGYGSRSDIPSGILTAMQFAIAQAFEHRGDEASAIGLVTPAVERGLSLFWNGALDHGEVCAW